MDPLTAIFGAISLLGMVKCSGMCHDDYDECDSCFVSDDDVD